MAHRAADAQRLTGNRHVHIAVVYHDRAGLRDPIKQRRIRFQVRLLVVSHGKKHRRNFEQFLRQRQKRLHIRFIRFFVQHIAYKKNCIRRLLLNFCNQACIVFAEGFSMEVGN